MATTTDSIEYLPVSKDEMPVQKKFVIDGTTYGFEFRYNDRYDFYTVIISDANDTILHSTRVNYMTNLIDVVNSSLGLAKGIYPVFTDNITSGIAAANAVGSDIFDDVKLCLIAPDGDRFQ